MSSIGAISTSGLIAAQTDVATVAANVANSTDSTAGATAAPFGSSAVAAPSTPAPPLSGTQPNGAAGQVFQALSATNTETAGGGVSATVTSGSGGGSGLLSPNVIQDLTNLSAASAAYQANLSTLEAANNVTQQSLQLSV